MELLKPNKSKTFAFSGYRPNKFDFPLMNNVKYEKLINKILEEIMQAVELGYTNAIVGGAPGFDILSAELIVIARRVASQDIKLICALPYNDFSNSKHFDKNWKLRYDSMIECCDYVINVSGKTDEIRGCYRIRNKYMIDNSSKLICYHTGKKGGTANTILYAENKGLEIVNIAELL